MSEMMVEQKFQGSHETMIANEAGEKRYKRGAETRQGGTGDSR